MATIAPTPAKDGGLPEFSIGGVRLHALTMDQAVHEVIRWRLAAEHHFVCVRDAHGIVRAQREPELLGVHEAAGLVVTDGMPLVWRARSLGFSQAERICGRDLMLALCDKGRGHRLRHFFYGGAPGVAALLAEEMTRLYPGLKVAGWHSPPFRPLTVEEDRTICTEINASGADIVWVGMSTPTQEMWMSDCLPKLQSHALIGVGAAFDFHTGRTKSAPLWMQQIGLEWFFRILQEPRRLLGRYLTVVPKFVYIVMKEALQPRHRR
ncbi:WecB/TagA/CpsF family glycosyltransferase [bacterium AH-315-P15]|nr:WecB/TagA/CpsF family glycosyltransferase [bacterium AH-315-P15]